MDFLGQKTYLKSRAHLLVEAQIKNRKKEAFCLLDLCFPVENSCILLLSHCFASIRAYSSGFKHGRWILSPEEISSVNKHTPLLLTKQHDMIINGITIWFLNMET